ncbi:hypothetical protein [Rhodopila sp.]|uniref:hypothetical protein n=1 Tax=Rhodopila sp. TaxID=2480087 RepID=UPI003D0A763F
MTDTLTVIRSRYLRLAKTIHADGRTEAYGNAKTIDLFEMPAHNLDAIGYWLARLLPQPSCAVVFGAIADPARIRNVRRLAYPDPATGDPPTLRAVPHQWVALDMDGVARPDSIRADDLAACAAEAVQCLPGAFHGVRCIVQATTSHGIKLGCRLRLWFWLSRPATGDELGFWLKQYPVDPCTFRPAQPIYTAAPVFVGRPDHLPCRIVDTPGAACVMVPHPDTLKPPSRPPELGRRLDRETTSDSDVVSFVDDIISRVRAAPDTAKHYTLRNMARLLGGIQHQARFSDAEAVRWLVDALPSTALDLDAAQKTAQWGLDAGRHAPIPVPRRKSDRPHVPDSRRQTTARTAFRLLRMGVSEDQLLATLHAMNGCRDQPLPPHVIAETASWAAQQSAGYAHAG